MKFIFLYDLCFSLSIHAPIQNAKLNFFHGKLEGFFFDKLILGMQKTLNNPSSFIAENTFTMYAKLPYWFNGQAKQ